MRSRSLRLAPLALLVVTGATGCLASRNDIQLLQNEMRAARASDAARDSAQLRELMLVRRDLGAANDSLAALATRLSRFQASVGSDIYEVNRQLLTIQELTGQSQRRIQELRATLEDRASTAATTPAPAANPASTAPVGAGDSTNASAPPPAAQPAAPGLPGPNRLFELAKDQLDRGSPAAARTALDQLIRTYPTADIVPTAQFYVAEAYGAEGNRTAADSVYSLVVTRYPKSDRAPTALYKHAQSLRARGRTTQARTELERLVREYPRSDEATLARDLLRTMR